MKSIKQHLLLYSIVALSLCVCIWFCRNGVREISGNPKDVCIKDAGRFPPEVAAARRRIRDNLEHYLRGPRDGAGATETSIAMSVLLDSWDPNGCSESELIRQIGPPSRRDDSALYYEYDNGQTRSYWSFSISNGKVTGVIRHPSS